MFSVDISETGMPYSWIPDLKGMLLVTNGPSDEVISYFVENSSGCPFNYLDEILFYDKRFQTNHFYILIHV